MSRQTGENRDTQIENGEKLRKEKKQIKVENGETTVVRVYELEMRDREWGVGDLRLGI